MVYRIGRFLLKLISKIFFPVTVKGLENIPREGSFILAANHVSNFDPFLIGSFCGRILSFPAKDSLFKNKISGSVLRSLNAFPIRREEADFAAIREALRRLKSGKPLLVFPEGTRKGLPGQKKIQQGIGLLAVKSAVPVYPARIEGSDLVLPVGAKWFNCHPMTITIGKPVVFQKDEPYPQIAQKAVDAIYALK